MNENYAGSLFEEDFASSSEGSAKINSWVAKKTNNKITQVIEERPIDKVKLILINAIYFKAKWRDPFDNYFTKAELFTPLLGEKIKVPMMHKTTFFDYLDEGEYRALKIPYRGYETSMIVYLPKEMGGILKLEREIRNINILEQLTLFASEKIHLSLPKFKIEAEYKLRRNITDLGMPQAFTDDANFTGITDHPAGLEITDVIHKTFIEVEEWGTEAAAVTIIPAAPTGPPPSEVSPPIEFRMDHPFIFLIYDSVTKSVLFFGRVLMPSETTEQTAEELEAQKKREKEKLSRLFGRSETKPTVEENEKAEPKIIDVN